MIVKKADALRDLVTNVFVAAGADDRNANVVAEHLVLANLSGVDTHGVIQGPLYVDSIRKKLIVPTAWPETIEERPTSVLVSGNWTFGQVAAKYTMEMVIKKAKEQGVAVGGLVQSNHIGRLGNFVGMATPQGLIAMVWGGGYGGADNFAILHGVLGLASFLRPTGEIFAIEDRNKSFFFGVKARG